MTKYKININEKNKCIVAKALIDLDFTQEEIAQLLQVKDDQVIELIRQYNPTHKARLFYCKLEILDKLSSAVLW